MSITKNKVGRPKKETALSPKEASAVEAKKAVDDIMSKSAETAANFELYKQTNDNLLQSEPDVLGTSPETDATKDVGQADFIPGTVRPDPTYLPDRCYDEGMGSERRVTLKSDYHYCWVVDLKLTQFRSMGYKFCLHDGGSQSGLANRGFLGTGLYERTLDNHIRNGDTFLMFAPVRLYEQFVAEDKRQADAWTIAAETDLANKGYRHGVRTFKEEDGQITYN